MKATMIGGAALLAFAAPAYADDADFILNNQTGKAIKLVELSEAGKAAWAKEVQEEDIKLGPIKAGGRRSVYFKREAKACSFDVRLTLEDDSQAVWPGLNVCNYAYADFAFKGAVPVVKGS